MCVCGGATNRRSGASDRENELREKRERLNLVLFPFFSRTVFISDNERQQHVLVVAKDCSRSRSVPSCSSVAAAANGAAAAAAAARVVVPAAALNDARDVERGGFRGAVVAPRLDEEREELLLLVVVVVDEALRGCGRGG